MSSESKRRFVEIESLTEDYFDCYLSPVMGRVRGELSERTATEMRDRSDSAAGILSSGSSAGVPGGDPYASLKVTGEWTSKTTEDYISMCKERILGDKGMQHDLAVVAEEWRTAVIGEIGRTRYDELSAQLGCDMAYAYIDHRVEELMIGKMVRDGMPQSSAEYIIRKAATSSLFGLPGEMSKSPLAAEIEARGEAAYNPSLVERGAGMLLGSAVDAVSFGGAGSWGAFARFVGIDVVFGTGMEYFNRSNTDGGASVEDCISKAVFGSDSNVFTAFRNEAQDIRMHGNDYNKRMNNQLTNKLPVSAVPTIEWGNQESEALSWGVAGLDNVSGYNSNMENTYADVPPVIAPGSEEGYLEDMNALREEQETAERTRQETETPTDGWDAPNAEQSGALPLNTLANAVLAKSDQMNRTASGLFEENARETVTRTRGIQ